MQTRLRKYFLLLFLMAFFLIGCGQGVNKDKKHLSTETNNQTLRLNIRTEPFSLNPGLANDSTSSSVLLQTFEGLTRIGPTGKVQNAIAKEIDVSKDLMTYTFTLRKDAKWTNGDPVTAHDFEFAWKWVLNPENQSKYAYQLYYLKNAEAANAGKVPLNEIGVEALNNQTLKVRLENPTPYFLQLTAFYTYFPVNSRIAKQYPKWFRDAGKLYTSNGPFKMVEWDHHNKIVLTKNENYWDRDAVTLKRIEMYMINNPLTEINMFQTGELDWAGSPTGTIPTEAIPSLKATGDLKVQPIAGTYWYKFNTEKVPLNNVHIRKALSYAIDRQLIVNRITQGGQIPATAAVPPTMIPENREGYFHDAQINKAKQLLQKGLRELGYSTVNELPPITLSFNTDDAHAKVAQAIQDMWKRNLGIAVELNNAEWAVYIEQLHQGDYQIGRMGWLGDFNDPINFLELFKEPGGNNDTRWYNQEFKALLEKSANETDPEKRLELLKEAESILMNEMPVMPIYFYTNVWVQSQNLHNVVLSGLGDAQFKWAYFE